MIYFLLFISVMLAVANYCLLHKFANRNIENMGDSLFFNGGISAMWIVCITAFAVLSQDLVISADSAFYGAIYGVIICSFLLFQNLALASGPVSLTILIGSCPFILTTLYGVLFMNQEINIMHIIGTVAIIIALVLCVGTNGKEKLSAKWLVFSVLLFFAGGGVGILYMVFGESDGAKEINGMMFCASLVASALYFVLAFVANLATKMPRPKIHKNAVPFIILCGIFSCTYMRINVYLSSVIPAVVFFPVGNGSLVIFSTLAGVLLFKERLSKAQTAGMLIGLLALIITGIA